MKTQVNKLILQSNEHYGRRVPPHALGEILRTLPGLIRGSVRMSFEGRSTARGRKPDWLEAASDVRFIDHDGDDETTLYFETPILGEAAPKLYEQSELWPSRPDPEDTAFDLLADVLEDVRRHVSDSQRFDQPLLQKLHGMKHGLNGTFQSCLLNARRYPEDRPATLDKTVIDNADDLSHSTPDPKQVRVAGLLDMIRASTNTVGVKLDTGEEIRGVLLNQNAAQIHDLLNQKITLLGKAIFRPSGSLLRVDVAEVRVMEQEDVFFLLKPTPQLQTVEKINTTNKQRRTSNVAAIIGRWPGDESDAEIQRILQEMK